jgi:hypothetical protein
MESLIVGVHPQREGTSILAVSSSETPMLKATFASQPRSRRALPALLEAIALWQGMRVRAALVVDVPGALCESSLYRDTFPDFGNDHYSFEYVRLPPGRRRASAAAERRCSPMSVLDDDDNEIRARPEVPSWFVSRHWSRQRRRSDQRLPPRVRAARTITKNGARLCDGPGRVAAMDARRLP